MIPFRTKSKALAGTNLGEVYKNAYKIFHEIEKTHERYKRLKLFKAAIEAIKSSRNKPVVKMNPNNKNEILYRFAGQTANQLFIVQIKENKRNRKKHLMSCFPIE